jgi:regulatory protein
MKMRKITAIEVRKRTPNRVNVHLDGEFAFGLARIVAAWLRVGQEISEEKIEQLLAEDARERAYQQAMLFLSYRARSESEIRKNLRKHEIPEAVIEETLERLRQDGLANDSQFASAWVENRNAFRPRSRRLMAMELRRRSNPQWKLWMMKPPLTKQRKRKLRAGKIWNGMTSARSSRSFLHAADFPTRWFHRS